MPKFSLNLPKPMPASNDCLPHAAMNLGSVRNGGIRPTPGMVHRLVLEPQMNNWVLYRLDDAGGFVGDSWHGTLEDAFLQARNEFGVDLSAAIQS
jgi:hypothetical protein